MLLEVSRSPESLNMSFLCSKCQMVVYLRPIDLISFSKTCRGINSILKSKPSRDIWRRAWLNVPGLPGRPSGMTEVDYATLVFSNDRTVCNYPPLYRLYLIRTLELSQALCVRNSVRSHNPPLPKLPKVRARLLLKLCPYHSVLSVNFRFWMARAWRKDSDLLPMTC